MRLLFVAGFGLLGGIVGGFAVFGVFVWRLSRQAAAEARRLDAITDARRYGAIQ